MAIKQAEPAFTVRMREFDIDVLKLNQAADAAVLAEVQDARARQVATKDQAPQVILAVAAVLRASRRTTVARKYHVADVSPKVRSSSVATNFLGAFSFFQDHRGLRTLGNTTRC